MYLLWVNIVPRIDLNLLLLTWSRFELMRFLRCILALFELNKLKLVELAQHTKVFEIIPDILNYNMGAYSTSKVSKNSLES